MIKFEIGFFIEVIARDVSFPTGQDWPCLIWSTKTLDMGQNLRGGQAKNCIE
jgi:hypothetical protein